MLVPARALVLSLYLDLDPSRVPTPRERSIELSGLLSGVERRARGDPGPGHSDRMGLRRDIDRLRRVFDENADITAGARALAAFACDPAGLFEVLRLPCPVEPSVTLDRSPRLLPLLAQLARGRWAVLLVSRDIAAYCAKTATVSPRSRCFATMCTASTSRAAGRRRVTNAGSRKRCSIT